MSSSSVILNQPNQCDSGQVPKSVMNSVPQCQPGGAVDIQGYTWWCLEDNMMAEIKPKSGAYALTTLKSADQTVFILFLFF